jgi:hypothetical protein
MSYAAPFELLADAAGSVTFGWADEGVFYARFSRVLSARVGEAFAAQLRLATKGRPFKYFADAHALESYDLLARSAIVRVVSEHRRKFEQINILAWSAGELSDAFVAAMGEPLYVTRDALDFEARLLALAPRARAKLGRPEPRHRARWPLRR